MKIEAGKYYKLRNGKKAYVVCIVHNPFSDESYVYPIMGFIEDRNGTASWTLKGESIKDSVSEWDIVEEWRDPQTWEVTVYIARMGTDPPHTFAVFTGGQCWMDPKSIIATKKITITEGDLN
jgi:hypothetical protein